MRYQPYEPPDATELDTMRKRQRIIKVQRE